MQVCVLGAGVIGLTTAYFLASEGHKVTIFDRNGLPGQEASYANGGQLSYSYVAPLAAPSALLSLPKYLFDRGSPLRFHLRACPDQWSWVLHFLRACWPSSYRRHTAELSSLAYLSREMIEKIVAREAIDFDYGRRGKLVIYRNRQSLRAAAELVAFQKDLGADQSLLDEEGCISLEPSLASMRGSLTGGVFTPSEDVGDCHKFCVALDGLLRDRYGVERLYHHRIGRLKTENRRVRAVSTNHGEIEADMFVMTAGLSSRELMRPLGVRLPLCALKGYSFSVPVDGSRDALKVSVTDSQNKIVYARLGEFIRIAAMVDIGAAHGAIDQERTETLKRHVRASFPDLGPLDAAKVWAGERPATAQGKPIVGASPFENLYLNVGHGALGFTLACGSAKLVTELMQGGPTTIDARPFRLGTVH
ncbi:MAG: D-amino acid dehydrogenase [Mesorhizobium sp.]